MENKYEEMYEKMVAYEQEMHEKNQKRIRIGLKCILIIPLIFLILLFGTSSNKVIFLILWIVSLFALASYLIAVEYADYNLQEKMNEWKDEEDRSVDALLGQEFDDIQQNLTNAVRKIDDTLNAKAETERLEKKASEVTENE